MSERNPKASDTEKSTITADAVALQERDEFRELGWLKIIAPAKVNLHLAIGNRRDDGYHEASTIMHAINLHDVVYMRRILPDSPHYGSNKPHVRIIPTGDTPVPSIDSDDNIATKAIMKLANALELPKDCAEFEVRIEKSIPAEGGLGGGSTDAAAVLVGAARLWNIPADEPAIEETARTLGADVPFFLHGGCSAYAGAGDVFVRSLAPSKRALALVKPEGGVSTPAAYHAFDEAPHYAAREQETLVETAETAEDVPLFNNLASASERLMPELAEVRTWLERQTGARNVLLCGSGATTFAACDDFASACAVVAAARKRGWWARATSFGSARVTPVSTVSERGQVEASDPDRRAQANEPGLHNQPTQADRTG